MVAAQYIGEEPGQEVVVAMVGRKEKGAGRSREAFREEGGDRTLVAGQSCQIRAEGQSRLASPMVDVAAAVTWLCRIQQEAEPHRGVKPDRS